MSFFDQSQLDECSEVFKKSPVRRFFSGMIGPIFITIISMIIVFSGSKLSDSSFIATKTERGIVLKKEYTPVSLYPLQPSIYEVEVMIITNNKLVKAEITKENWRELSFGDEIIITYGYGRFSNDVYIKNLIKK